MYLASNTRAVTLANMSFDKIFHLTAGVYFIFIPYLEVRSGVPGYHYLVASVKVELVPGYSQSIIPYYTHPWNIRIISDSGGAVRERFVPMAKKIPTVGQAIGTVGDEAIAPLAKYSYRRRNIRTVGATFTPHDHRRFVPLAKTFTRLAKDSYRGETVVK